MSISGLFSYIVRLRLPMMAGPLSDYVISPPTMVFRYASRIAWLAMVGVWLFLDLSVLVLDARAACLG